MDFQLILHGFRLKNELLRCAAIMSESWEDIFCCEGDAKMGGETPDKWLGPKKARERSKDEEIRSKEVEIDENLIACNRIYILEFKFI